MTQPANISFRASVSPQSAMRTDKTIQALRPDPERPGSKHHDRDSLYLWVARSGSKSWRLRLCGRSPQRQALQDREPECCGLGGRQLIEQAGGAAGPQ
jgi:hypothetical protein